MNAKDAQLLRQTEHAQKIDTYKNRLYAKDIDIAELKADNKRLLNKLSHANQQLGLMHKLKNMVSEFRIWKPKTTKLPAVTAIAEFSDLHHEQRITSAQMNGLNEYTPSISRERVNDYTNKVIADIDMHRSHFDIKEMILACLGDLINGHLRDEDLKTNYMPPLKAFREVRSMLIEMVKELLKTDIERLYFIGIAGNHARLTKKIEYSDNFDYNYEIAMYLDLAEYFKEEPRMVFNIPESEIAYCEVYDQTIRFFHGHQIRYKRGVGGISIPANKVLLNMDRGRPANITRFAHHHTFGENSNGSICGYTPYAMQEGYAYEPPSQTVFYVQPQLGMTHKTRIYLDKVRSRR